VDEEVGDVARPRWRAIAARACFVTVIAVQVGFAVNGYREPHKFFAFQPFNESSTWSADIVRVTWDGHRIPVDTAVAWGDADDPYDWNTLTDMAALQNPGQQRHAYMGVGATIDFLDDALDWIATHTPADHETRYLEARVTYYENTHGPKTTVVRSEERERA
jgi:hypothetical protein